MTFGTAVELCNYLTILNFFRFWIGTYVGQEYFSIKILIRSIIIINKQSQVCFNDNDLLQPTYYTQYVILKIESILNNKFFTRWDANKNCSVTITKINFSLFSPVVTSTKFQFIHYLWILKHFRIIRGAK